LNAKAEIIYFEHLSISLNLGSCQRKVISYNLQTFKRNRPDWFHEELKKLLNLIRQKKNKPIN